MCKIVASIGLGIIYNMISCNWRVLTKLKFGKTHVLRFYVQILGRGGCDFRLAGNISKALNWIWFLWFVLSISLFHVSAWMLIFPRMMNLSLFCHIRSVLTTYLNERICFYTRILSIPRKIDRTSSCFILTFWNMYLLLIYLWVSLD